MTRLILFATVTAVIALSAVNSWQQTPHKWTCVKGYGPDGNEFTSGCYIK